MAETTKKVTTEAPKATEEAKPAAAKGNAKRSAAIKAFMALPVADRMSLYGELGDAVNHDQDKSSQGLESSNDKYEALLNADV